MDRFQTNQEREAEEMAYQRRQELEAKIMGRAIQTEPGIVNLNDPIQAREWMERNRR